MAFKINQLFENHRLAVMGILNVTPDSFSDGGQFDSKSRAVAQAIEMADAGVEVVDIGGESTRPGSNGVDVATELERIIPVIEALRLERPELTISVDTSKVAVARTALEQGAKIVNDVTAGSEPGMCELVAEHEAGFVLMHMRGKPRTMQKDTHYRDVVGEVGEYLVGRAEAAERAGVANESIALDPGIGFGKSLQGNLDLLRELPRLAELGYPLLVGTSRKSFLGLITDAEVDQRLGATLASLVPTMALSRAIVRVHDTAEVLRFRAVLEALDLGLFQFERASAAALDPPRR